MSKIVNEINNDFTIIPNTILQDTRVSGLAFKIYCYIAFRLGRNKEWEFYNNEILSHFKEGKKAFANAKKQLLEYGYLVKLGQNHNDDGSFAGNDYAIYTIPQNAPYNQKGCTVEGTTLKASTLKGDTNNNDINKKDITKNDLIKQKINKKEIPVSANFAHTQNYEDIIENFMQEKYPQLPEITASTLRRFVGCMIVEQSKKDNKELNRDEISAIFADIIIKCFPNIQVKPEIPVIKESLTTQSDIEKMYCAFLENEKARTDTIQFKRVAPKIKEALKECETIGVLLGRIQTYLEYCTETKGWYSKKDIQSWFNAGFYSAEKQKYYQDGIAKEKAKQPKTEAQKFLINTENRKAVVDTEAVKKQEEVLMEYAKVKTEKPEFMENFKKVLKNYFGGSFASTIDNLKIKSINQNEIVFMLPNQFYADIMQRNKQKFEETCKREIGGFYKKAFTGSVKLVAWKN